MIYLDMEDTFVSYLSARNGLSNNSIKRVRSHYAFFIRWLNENNLPLDKYSVEKFILYLKTKYKPASINLVIGMLKHLDAYYESRGAPLDLVKGYKYLRIDEVHIDILTLDEVDRLISTPLPFKWKNPRFYQNDQVMLDFTALLAYTGMRYSEAQQLKVKDIYIDEGKILIEKSKNGTYRHVFIPPVMVDRIKTHIKNLQADDFVFTSLYGKPLHAGDFLRNLKRRAKYVGITKRIYPHLLRHTFATQALIDGVPIEQVATILGHKEIGTTYEKYTHLANDQIRRAMYRHSLFKKAVEPRSIAEQIKEAIVSFRIGEDKRFKFNLAEGTDSLTLRLSW